MKVFSSIATCILVLLLISCAKPQGPTETSQPEQNIRKIRNGIDISASEFGHVGALYVQLPGSTGYINICTATLVDANHVLTAAHCDRRDEVEGLKYFFSRTAAPKDTNLTELAAVTQLDIHPDWNGTATVDLAIFTLDKRLVVNEPFHSFLPEEGELNVGDSLHIVGFGTDTKANSATRKRKGRVEIERLEERLITHKIADSTDQATCFGDSGGPALFTSGDQTYLVGVTAFGSFPIQYRLDPDHVICEHLIESNHIDLRHYHDWITSRINPSALSIASQFGVGERISVDYKGFGITSKDWVAIAAKGSPEKSFVTFKFLPSSSADGRIVFDKVLAPGSYEVRAYLNNSYNRVATASFEVISNASVAVSNTNLLETDEIEIDYSGFGISDKDWIAIAPAGAAEKAFVAFKFLPSGAGSIKMDRLPAGEYEVRGYYNNSYDRVASASFTVKQALSLAKTSFRRTESIEVSYQGFGKSNFDWIAIAPAASAESGFIAWQYVKSNEGKITFNALAPGKYEVRGYFNNSYDRVATAKFSVDVVLKTEKSTYSRKEPVRVLFEDLLVSKKDWIAIAKAGAANNKYLAYQYANESGELLFNGLEPGDYEVRAYLNNGYQRAATASFSVRLPLSTDKDAYTAGEAITVEFEGLIAENRDWIAIAKAGSSNRSYLTYQYANAQGSVVFDGLAPGAYEVRAFANNGYTRLATHSFTVEASLSTSSNSYSPDETIVVTYDDFGHSSKDWIAVYKIGSSDRQFIDWTYVSGVSGTVQFDALAPGEYEIRGFVNNGYTKIASSQPFTVE